MRILVTEDEQKVSALVKRGLTAERYAVDVTADGVEGLEYFEAFPYDLIILDLPAFGISHSICAGRRLSSAVVQ
jgi:two-component system copper resistance phosphate regulon response regulator CusR